MIGNWRFEYFVKLINNQTLMINLTRENFHFCSMSNDSFLIMAHEQKACSCTCCIFMMIGLDYTKFIIVFKLMGDKLC